MAVGLASMRNTTYPMQSMSPRDCGASHRFVAQDDGLFIICAFVSATAAQLLRHA
jgi:hypothetical protein